MSAEWLQVQPGRHMPPYAVKACETAKTVKTVKSVKRIKTIKHF